MKAKVVLIVICFGLLCSCSLKLHYIYSTYLDISKDKSLTYQDSLMKFKFYPQPNGIYFEIQNLTNENIFLLWDASYFIEPNNNSSNALNTDILNTENKIVSKENYESIIPKKGTFSRFTTSAKNLSTFQTVAIANYNITPDYSVQMTNYNEKYLINRYWITYSKISYVAGDEEDLIEQKNKEIARIKFLLQSNNNLGLGFTFRKGEKKFEYDFRIKIDKVMVYCKNSNTPEDVIKVDTLIH